jgi:signal transduction histidine kinase
MREALDVLLVEDSETDAKLILRELRQAGFAPRPVRVETALALREALSSRAFRLVICDSSVAALGPVAVLELTRELAPDALLFVVSGTITEESAVEVVRTGARDYVTKANLHRLGPAVARELAVAAAKIDHAVSPPHRMLAAQEEELRRMGRALHDRFGALLTQLRMTIDAVRNGRAPIDELDEALATVDRAMEQARDFSVELWPIVLDDLGLPGALRWLAERRTRSAGVAFEIDVCSERLSPAVEAAFFRIAQEALTNVHRHADAERVVIALAPRDEGLELSISDDGKGFDTRAALARARAGASLGLLSMRERARLAGCKLTIESALGEGTVVRARAPRALGERT